MTDAATSPPSDDAYILRVSRVLRERNERIQFHETEVMEDGIFKIAVAIVRVPLLEGEPEVADRTASTTVLIRRDIAHGRRVALEKLMSAEEAYHAAE